MYYTWFEVHLTRAMLQNLISSIDCPKIKEKKKKTKKTNNKHAYFKTYLNHETVINFYSAEEIY